MSFVNMNGLDTIRFLAFFVFILKHLVPLNIRLAASSSMLKKATSCPKRLVLHEVRHHPRVSAMEIRKSHC